MQIQPRILAIFDMIVLPRTSIYEWKTSLWDQAGPHRNEFLLWPEESRKTLITIPFIHSFVHSLISSFNQSLFIYLLILGRVPRSRNTKMKKMIPAFHELTFQETIRRRGTAFRVQHVNPSPRSWPESKWGQLWMKAPMKTLHTHTNTEFTHKHIPWLS